MKVIILAAGRGTQLGNLTADRPKCMLPFGEETILQRQIRLLSMAGIPQENIIVVLGYMNAKVPRGDYQIVINEDYYKTDNSYSLYLALKNIHEDVLVMDGDLIFEKTELESVLSHEGNYVCCNQSATEFGDTGVTLIEQSDIVDTIGKHIVDSPYQYAGILRLSSEVIANFVEELKKNFSSWYTIPLNNILKKYCFRILVPSKNIIGINTSFDYVSAKRIFKVEDYRILITAASGFLGQKIYQIFKRDYEVIGTKYKDSISRFPSLDLNDHEKVKAFFELNNPKLLINCAGIADPDKCEKERQTAYQVNVLAVKTLCEVACKYNCKVIHISTDYVFDGSSEMEYETCTTTNPVNYYGYTKAEAEKIVLSYPGNLVVRIPIIYGYNGPHDKKTFPQKVLNTLKNGEVFQADNKQIRYPVLIDEIALMLSSSLSETGIIHITSDKGVTKYEWAKILAKEFGYDEKLIQEDLDSDIHDRPLHTKLKVDNNKFLASNIETGTSILKKQMTCSFRLIYSTQPTEYICERSVGEFRYVLGQQLSDCLPAELLSEIDCIVPIPSSGLYYAMGLSQSSKIPYVQALFKTETEARTFQISSNKIREKIINAKIKPIRELLNGKTIALVDEAIFTGTTLKVVCDMCKACGVKKIYICIPTSPCYNRCEQYMRPERELLSAYVQSDKLKDYFKVQGVYFQSYSNFCKSLQIISSVCKECFIPIETETKHG